MVTVPPELRLVAWFDRAMPASSSSDAEPQGARARVELVALELFTERGFEQVTIDELAAAAGIGRRTFFRHFATKADAVWGDFDGHVARLDALLADTDDNDNVLATICAAYVEVNDYAEREYPVLRRRMQLILTEPALLSHSQLRYRDVDRAVAEHVATRSAAQPGDLIPRLLARCTRAAAISAFETWLADPRVTLSAALNEAFDALAGGFPSLTTRQ